MRYLFGAYTLDIQHYALYHQGLPVPCERRAFRLLVYLVQQRHRVVTRQELFDHLWPDPFVSDAALERCVATARRVVGDSGRAQGVIQTRHGVGYRFVADVVEQPGAAPDDHALSPGDASEMGITTPVASQPRPEPSGVSPGERKLVTVLSGALAHPLALAERLGLDGFQRLRQTLFALVQDSAQRYDGMFQPYGDDGFLVLFGVPVAQEDHARRAVLAALDIQQRVGEPQAVDTMLPQGIRTIRIGLHTGAVAVGGLGDGAGTIPTMIGSAAHMAPVLQTRAVPGTILCSAATARLVQDAVHLEGNPVPITGQGLPVETYKVLGARSQQLPSVWHSERVLSRFVGRARERAILQGLLAQVEAGHGQVIGIVGEPGMGKSRLLAEFHKGLGDRSVTYLEGHCRSYGVFSPYAPIGELLRRQCGLDAMSALDVVSCQVDQLLQEVGLSPEDNAPYLLKLLGSHTSPEALAPLSPEAIKARTFATLQQVHLRSSQQQPLILVVEDLHWIDLTSEAYLAALVEHLAGFPLLLLTTYRPGYRPLWMDKSYATQLTLPRLTQEESAVMVQAILPPEQRIEALVQQILDRAEGNPLFLEELSHARREQDGLDAVTPVPETIQAVLAARIDRLPLEAKHVLHTAAVIGMEVPIALLETLAALPKAVLRASLDCLLKAEFLYEACLVPESVYTFKHALTQEVAYGSLLQERRLMLHACIVDVIEALGDERMAEQVERLAHHAFWGEVWDKAFCYFRSAGMRAVAQSAQREAVRYFEQALLALTYLPESHTLCEQAIDLHFDLATALIPQQATERALNALREAERLATALDDSHRLGQASYKMSVHLRQIGDYDAALAYGQRTHDLAVVLGDLSLQIAADFVVGQVHNLLGDYRRAIELFRRALASLEPDQMYEHFGWICLPPIQCRIHLVSWLAEIGAFTEGIAYGDEALRIAEGIDRPIDRLAAYSRVTLPHLSRGDVYKAIPCLERSLSLSKEADVLLYSARAASHLAVAYARSGRAAEALPLAMQAEEQYSRNPLTILFCIETYLLADHVEKASQLALRTLELAQERHERGVQAHTLRLLGDIAMYRDPPDVEQAEAHYQRALARSHELGMRPLQAHCHRGLGTLYCQTGQLKHARTELSTAIEMYRDMEMTFWLPETERTLEVLERR
jgi:DNA-binding winged helix-turn-helix (wHTH) protein/tetratricopeptide (TPR) repeat protein